MLKKLLNLKIRNIMKIMSSFWKNVKDVDYNTFDAYQIANLEILATNIFLNHENLEVGQKDNDFINKFETKNLKMEEVINILKSNKYYNELNDNEKSEFLKKILPDINKQSSQILADKTELKKLQSQLMGLKNLVTRSGGSFDENFYHILHTSIKDAFEYVYIYLKNPENTTSYKTNYFIPEQKLKIMTSGKKALQSIVHEKKQKRGENSGNDPMAGSAEKTDDIVKFLMTQIHDRSSVKY